MDAATVGARIRERRLEKGLTQEQLGAPNLTGGYISLVECGHRRPSRDALDLIAARLDLEVDELLRGTPPGLEPELELRLHQVRRTLDDGDVETATTTAMSVLQSARQHDLNRVEARAEEMLGTIAERAGRPEAALAHFGSAEELWANEPIHLRVDARTGTARCLRFLGDARMAVHTLDSYRRDLLASRPDPHALMKTYAELIQGYFAIGLPENARDAAHAALRLEGQVDDPDEIACMHLTLARDDRIVPPNDVGVVFPIATSEATVGRSIDRGTERFLSRRPVSDGWRPERAIPRLVLRRVNPPETSG